MTDEPRRSLRLRHPILHLDVVGTDGTEQSEHRVFCRYQLRSVPVDTCCACVHCDSIGSEPQPTVHCTVFVDETGPAPDELGVRTAVGTVLRTGTVVLERGATIGDVLRVLRKENRRSVAIVDPEHAVVGVVHEADLLHIPGPKQTNVDVARIMSGPVTIHESTPIRRALQILAGAHLREVAVVDDAGVPLGVFRDVDGLRWLGQRGTNH